MVYESDEKNEFYASGPFCQKSAYGNTSLAVSVVVLGAGAVTFSHEA